MCVCFENVFVFVFVCVCLFLCLCGGFCVLCVCVCFVLVSFLCFFVFVCVLVCVCMCVCVVVLEGVFALVCVCVCVCVCFCLCVPGFVRAYVRALFWALFHLLFKGKHRVKPRLVPLFETGREDRPGWHVSKTNHNRRVTIKLKTGKEGCGQLPSGSSSTCQFMGVDHMSVSQSRSSKLVAFLWKSIQIGVPHYHMAFGPLSVYKVVK